MFNTENFNIIKKKKKKNSKNLHFFYMKNKLSYQERGKKI